MNTISTVDNSRAGRTDFNEASPSGSSRKSASLGHFLKTAAVLGLALTGGAQARSINNFSHNRDLNDIGYGAVSSPPAKAYSYESLCKSGIFDQQAKGLNYEDCLEQEHELIDAVENSKPLKKLKTCFTASGSLTAALMGTSIASALTCTKAGLAVAASSITAATFSLVFPTVICGTMHSHLEGRLKATRDAALDCCNFFAKKADVQAVSVNLPGNVSDATVASNSTLKANSNLLSNSTEMASASVVSNTSDAITVKHP